MTREYDCPEYFRGELEAESIPDDDPARDGAVYWVWPGPHAPEALGPFADYDDAQEAASEYRREHGPGAYIAAAELEKPGYCEHTAREAEAELTALYAKAGPVFGLDPVADRCKIAARLMAGLFSGE